VAPVLTPNGTVDYYLPDGRWTHFVSGQVVEGGRWMREQHDFLTLPLMVRPNTIIPVGANDQRPDYDYADGVTFQVFELHDDATLSARVPTMTGKVAMNVQVSRAGQNLEVQARDTSKPWRVLLRGTGGIQSVEGGTPQADALGTLLIPGEGASRLNVRLQTA